jgi:hypothetical protein
MQRDVGLKDVQGHLLQYVSEAVGLIPSRLVKSLADYMKLGKREVPILAVAVIRKHQGTRETRKSFRRSDVPRCFDGWVIGGLPYSGVEWRLTRSCGKPVLGSSCVLSLMRDRVFKNDRDHLLQPVSE